MKRRQGESSSSDEATHSRRHDGPTVGKRSMVETPSAPRPCSAERRAPRRPATGAAKRCNSVWPSQHTARDREPSRHRQWCPASVPRRDPARFRPLRCLERVRPPGSSCKPCGERARRASIRRWRRGRVRQRTDLHTAHIVQRRVQLRGGLDQPGTSTLASITPTTLGEVAGATSAGRRVEGTGHLVVLLADAGAPVSWRHWLRRTHHDMGSRASAKRTSPLSISFAFLRFFLRSSWRSEKNKRPRGRSG